MHLAANGVAIFADEADAVAEVFDVLVLVVEGEFVSVVADVSLSGSVAVRVAVAETIDLAVPVHVAIGAKAVGMIGAVNVETVIANDPTPVHPSVENLVGTDVAFGVDHAEVVVDEEVGEREVAIVDDFEGAHVDRVGHVDQNLESSQLKPPKGFQLMVLPANVASNCLLEIGHFLRHCQ